MDSSGKSINSKSYQELTSLKDDLKNRIDEIAIQIDPKEKKDKKKNNARTERSISPSKDKTNLQSDDDTVRIQPKIDVHWDFLMKEMMWLAADFQSERKRQISNGKKLAGAVKQFHTTKESRRLREIAEAEARRRRLAAKLGRDVKTWWTKIEKIITFKQKLLADQLRQKRMDKHLVYLVKQTERYSEKLNQQLFTGDIEGGKEKYAPPSPHKNTRSKRNRHHRYIPYSTQTIEEALSFGTELSMKSRRGKRKLNTSPKILSSTNIEDTEEETTSKSRSSHNEQRLTRARSSTNVNRRVTFAPNVDERNHNDNDLSDGIGDLNIKELFLNPQYDADISDESIDFEDDGNNIVDDESTLEAEEKLGRDMTYKEELDLLRKEAEISIDEIRARFAPISHTKPPLTTDSHMDMNNSNVKSEITDVSKLSSKAVERDKSCSENSQDDAVVQDKAKEKKIKFSPSSSSTQSSISNGNKRTKSKRRKKSPPDETKRSNTLPYELNLDDSKDEEFHVTGEMELDDETTIEIEERMGKTMSHAEEIALLEEESNIPIEQLRAEYAKMQEKEADVSQKESHSKVEDPKAKDEPINSSKNPLLLLSLEEDDNMDEDEFLPKIQGEFDDETTLVAEEKLGREMSYNEEIALLKKQSEMPIEELLAMYREIENASVENADQCSNVEAPSSSKFNKYEESYQEPEIFEHNDTSEEEEEEFCPDSQAAVDDETTLEAEEKLGREMSYDEELNHLKRESEMSIEELRAMYLNNDDEVSAASDSVAQNDSSTMNKNVNGNTFEEDRSFDLNRKKKSNKKKENNRNEDVHESSTLSVLKASDDRIRQTAVSRPYLLSSWVHLREYQHVGLNWLVSIQSRRLNGILADEMGLGKTLQTISLLSYLASYKGIWGPHLIIVPTSCIVNWEVELKRFCPAFKVLCYHGSARRRKELRQGWTKSNWYHVVITSYQLAVQDAFAFKRKRWYYLVLDEAQNIKNFQSQRWQTLITFNTQRRLLLTGTPLQNNLMELWSLLHFLMPHIFRSRKEFSYWFSNPMSHIIEGNANRNDDLIGRLHGIIRPFVLRRLKKDVETQMPGKFEHIVKCQLSRRQMFLYEEFISRSSTRQALKKGGNFMGMMNVLMQLRKVCNHPDLFEPRSVITPFCMEALSFKTAGCIIGALESESSLDRLSHYLLYPLWTMGSAIPSFDESIHHDSIISEQSARLELSFEKMTELFDDQYILEPKPDEKTKPELVEILTRIWESAKQRKDHVIKRNSKINHWRCQTQSFSYPKRLIRAVEIQKPPLLQDNDQSEITSLIASTPKELLQMKKSQIKRANEMDDIISKFVFCVPRAGSQKPVLDANSTKEVSTFNDSHLVSQLMTPIRTYFRTFRKASARLNSFFPDKKLVQFDAGKLQTLAALLRDLKRDDHRCLIFTQMSKMLDILEAFLNLNGHTYVRLDGSTGVDSRQRLMDRFNNDTKIFCFILSTRSGGLGINLTGADTVIFYDSDWNPAMDAQAQDRAHRIGQTRDVHIYRLVTEHTIEENILIKAKQKRQLDLLVMDEGKFFASSSMKNTITGETTKNEAKDGNDVFTKKGLRDILGVKTTEDDNSIGASVQSNKSANESIDHEQESILNKEQMEKAMAVLEDEDDVKAMRGAQKEAAEELQEFDETVQFQKENEVDNDSLSRGSRDDDTVDDDQSRQSATSKDSRSAGKRKSTKKIINGSPPKTGKNPEINGGDAEMEKEFAAWQSKVGIDINTIASSLKPTEQYGIKFREEIDPFYSIHYDVIEEEQMNEGEATGEGDFDVDEIEEAKEAEERRAMDDGDLLATNPIPDALPEQRQMYLKEKASLRAKKKRRKLTGENWCTKIDGVTKLPFWYNEDTGEALWEKPKLLLELEADEIAVEKKWCALPSKPLLHVMSFLLPHPDRICCSSVCKQWRSAANDISFVKHVYPVEMGALSMDQSKLDVGHFTSISDAVEGALPGDTIELGDGHYWIHEPGICVDVPLRIIGDENDPSHVVLELSGSVTWKAKGGWIEGVTIRRPKMASETKAGMEIVSVQENGRFDMAFCVFDNEGGLGNVAKISGNGIKGRWHDVVLKNATENGHGLQIEKQAKLDMDQCLLTNNEANGISCMEKSVVRVSQCTISGNGGYGILLDQNSTAQIDDSSRIDNNGKGSLHNSEGSQFLKGSSLSLSSLLLSLGRKKIPDEVPSTRPRTRSNSVMK